MVWRVCGRRMRAATAIIVAPRVRSGRYYAENSGFGVAHLARADRHGGAKCLRDTHAERHRRGDAALHSGNNDAHIYADRAAQGKNGRACRSDTRVERRGLRVARVEQLHRR